MFAACTDVRVLYVNKGPRLNIYARLYYLSNTNIKGNIYDPVNNYNYVLVEDTKVNESIKKTNANKCTLSEIFLCEILKRFSTFYSGCRA